MQLLSIQKSREQGSLDEFLLVSAVAVWWVSGVLAATQLSFVLLRDEALRHQTLGFSLVGSITERLKQKDGRNKPVIEYLNNLLLWYAKANLIQSSMNPFQ